MDSHFDSLLYLLTPALWPILAEGSWVGFGILE